MHVKLVISGRGYHDASALPEELTLPAGASVDDALARIAELLPEGVRLPESCLVAVSGEHLGTLARHAERELADGDELLLVAPVAGG